MLQKKNKYLTIQLWYTSILYYFIFSLSLYFLNLFPLFFLLQIRSQILIQFFPLSLIVATAKSNFATLLSTFAFFSLKQFYCSPLTKPPLLYFSCCCFNNFYFTFVSRNIFLQNKIRKLYFVKSSPQCVKKRMLFVCSCLANPQIICSYDSQILILWATKTLSYRVCVCVSTPSTVSTSIIVCMPKIRNTLYHKCHSHNSTHPFGDICLYYFLPFPYPHPTSPPTYRKHTFERIRAQQVIITHEL